MKVAFATTDGMRVDEHFGRAGMFAVYEITGQGWDLAEMRRFADGRDEAVEGTRGMGDAHESAVQAKVDSLGDCKVIYVADIGGPSAARLVKSGIMPVKVKEGVLVIDELQRMLDTIKKTPPPWLRKALGENR